MVQEQKSPQTEYWIIQFTFRNIFIEFVSHFKHIYSYFVLFSKNTNTEHSTFLKIFFFD